MPFWVYILVVDGVSVGVGGLSGVVSGKLMLRGLLCFMCVGAGRNFVRISLGFSVVLTPDLHVAFDIGQRGGGCRCSDYVHS